MRRRSLRCRRRSFRRSCRRRGANGGEGLAERLHDLVVERPALKRVRMSDERDGTRRLGNIDRDLQLTRWPRDQGALLAAYAQILSLSTTRPWTTCESMISSMS